MTENVLDKIQSLKKQYDILDVIYCDHLRIIDLYLRIDQLARDTFLDDQRIIFVITSDKHNAETGLMLHSIQSVLNVVDIGNFFACVITTNPDIEQEYQYLLDNVSTDTSGMHIYLVDGDYTKMPAEDNDTYFIKYASIKENIETIKNLTDKEKYLFFESKHFCILPWIGLNVEADSSVRVCCESKINLGNCIDTSLTEIWNSERLKKIRVNLQKDVADDNCQHCYKKELLGRDSLRKSINRKFVKKHNTLKNTTPNGGLLDFNLSYWDIRYNNLCNLTCRSCSEKHSSSWYQVSKDLGKIITVRSPLLKAGKNGHDIFNQIMEHIDTVETIYFAGGEPLIIEEFYKILEILDQNRKHDTQLIYNINFTRTGLKDYNIFDLWRKFKNVSVGASLDGSGARGEYIRQGLNWDQVVQNRIDMLKKCPHVDFYVSSTVSILNVLHLPDFHREWTNLGLITAEDFNLQALHNPEWLAIDQLPREYKTKIKEKYKEHLDWLKPIDKLGRATFGFQSILKYIEKESTMDYDNFWKNASELDRYHGTDLITTFPELELLKLKENN